MRIVGSPPLGGSCGQPLARLALHLLPVRAVQVTATPSLGQKAAPCQIRYGSNCVEQLTRRDELLGLLQAGWSHPTANAPGLPRTPSGAVGIPRTPTGQPILFGTCAPHQGASAPLPPDVFCRVSVAASAGLLRYLRSNVGDRNCTRQKPSNPKLRSVVFRSPRVLHFQILTGCSVNA